jgi:hypothetical protein
MPTEREKTEGSNTVMKQCHERAMNGCVRIGCRLSGQ